MSYFRTSLRLFNKYSNNFYKQQPINNSIRILQFSTGIAISSGLTFATIALSQSNNTKQSNNNNTANNSKQDTIEYDEQDFSEPEPLNNNNNPNSSSRSYSSSNKYSHPTRSNILYATGNNVEELIDPKNSASRSILLEVYSPDCPSCKRLEPILDEVAAVLAKLQKSNNNNPNQSPVAIAVMDRSKNHKRGLLSMEEMEYSPILKFFPSCNNHSNKSECKPILYEGRHNAKSIIDFLHAQLPEHSKFDLKQAYSYICELEPIIQPRVLEAIDSSLKLELEHNPRTAVVNLQPCSTEFAHHFRTWAASGYRSILNAEEEKSQQSAMEASYKSWFECRKNKQTQTKKFWKDVEELAKEQLKQFEENEREENEASADDQLNDAKSKN